MAQAIPDTAMLRREVFETVTRIVREVIGDEDGSIVDISEATTFGSDLELESIELVAVAEKIQARWGKQVDFVAWLSGMELDRILQLTVGDLVEFIVGCLAR